MVTKAQKVRLGIFISVSLIFLIVMLGLIAGGKLFEKRDFYFIKYHDVSVNGLQIGGSVKYHGINVGRVDEISIDKDDVRNIIVKISLDEGTPIKTDVKATLAAVGITGLKSIELVGASIKSKMRKPGTYIAAGQSTLSNITGKAEVIAEKVELLLNNLNELINDTNREKINSILKNTDELITENSTQIDGTLANIDSMTYNLAIFSDEMNNSIKRINGLLARNEIDEILKNSKAFSDSLLNYDYVTMLNNLNETVSDVKALSNNINLTVVKGREDLLTTLESFTSTMDYLNEFSRILSEDPSILFKTIKK
ncbi:MAG: MlaD family protein [Candidatus Cloacimonadota bacterium]|nr:MlaD family protein [Candidatus Cloacimonadota bacterium]